MSMRIMLDTDVLADLDGHAELLATYSDLIDTEAELAALKARHPHSEIILIDRGLGDPTGEATVFDMEANADSVNQLPRWIAEKKAAGKRYLTGYCDRNNLPAVIAIAHREIWHWVATLDGTCHIDGFIPMRQPAAVQILGANSLGIHADLSIVLEDGWHRREAAAAVEEPFQLSELQAGSAGSSGNADTGTDPQGSEPAAAPSETAEEVAASDMGLDGIHNLATVAPAWDFYIDSKSIVANLRGTRTQIEAADVETLEARIRQLYPDTIQ